MSSKTDLHIFRGQKYSLYRIAKMNECKVSYTKLLKNVAMGLPIEVAVKNERLDGKTEKHREEQREKERIKKIMAVPINPKKDCYLSMYNEAENRRNSIL